MADDITFQTTAATPPSGTVVATDDVAGKHFQRVKIDLGGDGLSSPLERGAQTAANSLPVTTATDDPLVSQIGATNETAPGTDTAASGLNGRLQRIAQRLTSLIGLLPAALTGSGNLKTAVLEALPAGTNNIGDVDVLSVVPGTGATNLGKAEDAVHATGDTGVMALAVRKDTAAALAGADGDYAPLEVDASGRLHVAVGTSALPTGAATAANQANLGAVSAATLSSLASAATSAQLVAANSSRKGLLVYNTDSNDLYLKYGTTASPTDFTVAIPQNGYWEMPQPIYTGRIDAIWAADGSGAAVVTEI